MHRAALARSHQWHHVEKRGSAITSAPLQRTADVPKRVDAMPARHSYKWCATPPPNIVAYGVHLPINALPPSRAIGLYSPSNSTPSLYSPGMPFSPVSM